MKKIYRLIIIVSVIVQIALTILLTVLLLKEEITSSEKLTIKIQNISKDSEIIRLSDSTDFEWDSAIIKGTDNIEKILPKIIFYHNEQMVMEYEYSILEIDYRPWGTTITNGNDYFKVSIENDYLELIHVH